MTNDEAIAVIENEWRCVERQIEGLCDRDCGKCALALDDGGIVEAYKMAIAALRAQQEAIRLSTGWISVKDKLPDRDGSYIVHSGKSGAVFTAHFWARDGHWSGRSLDLNVTHWMPLPEPPKGGIKDD